MQNAYPGIPDFGGLHLVHTKPLTIKRSASSFVKDAVLVHPSFSRELNNRMATTYSQHLSPHAAEHNKDSQISLSIR